MDRTLNVDGHLIELTHLDKIYMPGGSDGRDDLRKSDLIDYYRRVAGFMIPHLRGRPLTLQRFPDGISGEGFYQKQVPDYFPEWIDRVPVAVGEAGREQSQVLCNDSATLVYLANHGCISLHSWLSRNDDLNCPDRMIFDLDPSTSDFGVVKEAARALRKLLSRAGMMPFVMTTGSRGLHVVAPLDGTATFDTVRERARRFAEELAAQRPRRFTTAVRKENRRDRLFLDYLRNSYGQTAVAPYSVRAKPGGPVATPLDWDELERTGLHSGSYTVRNLFRRLGQKQDPWGDIDRYRRPLGQS